MIEGTGLLASAFSARFKDDPDHLIFASGVSNSRETRPEAFLREQSLLQTACQQGKKLVYFSTCSVHDPDLAHSPYVKHKRAMEALVAASPRYAIFRLPQVVGHTPNPHTLTNFLYHQITTGSHFQVWQHARRNVIDIDDVSAIASALLQHYPDTNLVTNIACPFSISILSLVHLFEEILNVRANYELQDCGGDYQIESDLAQSVAHKLGITFDAGYARHLIQKYYAHHAN